MPARSTWTAKIRIVHSRMIETMCWAKLAISGRAANHKCWVAAGNNNVDQFGRRLISGIAVPQGRYQKNGTAPRGPEVNRRQHGPNKNIDAAKTVVRRGYRRARGGARSALSLRPRLHFRGLRIRLARLMHWAVFPSALTTDTHHGQSGCLRLRARASVSVIKH